MQQVKEVAVKVRQIISRKETQRLVMFMDARLAVIQYSLDGNRGQRAHSGFFPPTSFFLIFEVSILRF